MKPHYKPTNRQLQLNSLLRRLPFYQNGASAHLGAKLNQSYADFGYLSALEFFSYYTMYKRVGLAKAVIERPADLCWIDNPEIKLDEDTEDKEHAKLAKRLRLWKNFLQCDYMQRVGHYAGLIIRVADGQSLDRPLGKVRADAIRSVTPCWEGQLVAGSLDQDPASDRYGLPVNYTYSQTGVRQTAQRDGNEQFTVHWTRVLIWNEGAAGNTIFGQSSLEAPFNALIDWEKIRGAGGEGFRKQASLRAVLQAMKETQGQEPSDEELDALTEVITDMNTSFDSVPYFGGMELVPLDTTLGNPEHFKNTALEDVAAGAKWSAKGLIGAQTGVLAGSEDSSGDKQTAQSRRENYLTYQIMDWLEWLQVHTDFPAADRIIEWSDLLAPGDAEKLANANIMADVNYKTWQATGDTVYTGDEIRELTGWERIGLDDVEGFVDGGDGDERVDDVPSN